MIEDIKIGKLYKRKLYSSWKNPEKDIVVVTGTNPSHSYIVTFYYLDDPDEICEWNEAAFMEGFEECQ